MAVYLDPRMLVNSLGRFGREFGMQLNPKAFAYMDKVKKVAKLRYD